MTLKTWLAVAVSIVSPICCAVSQQDTNTSAREQFNQLVAQLQANPSNDALRAKTIQLALTLDPKPAIPAEAVAADGKAKTIFAHASSPDDLKAAAAAFAQASMFAPWVPDNYFNEAAAAEKAAQYDEATRALNFYLVAAPNAADAGEVRGRIEGLKFEQQKAAQEAAKRAVEEEQQNLAATTKRMNAVVGRWVSNDWGNNVLVISRSLADYSAELESTGSQNGWTVTLSNFGGSSAGVRFRLTGANGSFLETFDYSLNPSDDGSILTGTCNTYSDALGNQQKTVQIRRQ